MAKNLNSVLKTLSKHKGLSIKIGSVGGSGLWYCAKLTPHTIEEIGIENLNHASKETKMLERAKSKHNGLNKKLLPITISQLEYDLSIGFLNRPVVEIVDGISPDEPNTKVIYVKGFEKGKYWTIKEYTKAHLPSDKQRDFNTRLPRLAEMEN